MLFCNESSVSWNYCKLYYYWYNYWNIWFGSVLVRMPLSSCSNLVTTSLSTFEIWMNVNLTWMNMNTPQFFTHVISRYIYGGKGFQSKTLHSLLIEKQYRVVGIIRLITRFLCAVVDAWCKTKSDLNGWKNIMSVIGKSSSKTVLTSKTLQGTMIDSASQSCFWAVESGKVSLI